MFSSLGQAFLLTSSVSNPPFVAAAFLKVSMSTGSLHIQKWELENLQSEKKYLRVVISSF